MGEKILKAASLKDQEQILGCMEKLAIRSDDGIAFSVGGEKQCLVVRHHGNGRG